MPLKIIFPILVIVTFAFEASAKNSLSAQAEKAQYFTATSKALDTGLPLVFRALQPGKAVKKTDYPQLIIGTWEFDPKVRNGMPDPATNAEQVKFENLLGKPKPDGMGYLALVVTGNGKKQWFWYAKNKVSYQKQFKEIFLGKPAFPISFSFRDEKNWETHTDFISTLKQKN